MAGMGDCGVTICRSNWYAQATWYQLALQYFPDYPYISMIPQELIVYLKDLLPQIVVEKYGLVDLANLLPLLEDPRITSNPLARENLLALLSSCSATKAQRTTLANALNLGGEFRNILIDQGILIYESKGKLTNEEISVFKNVINLFPDPVKMHLNLLVHDEPTDGTGGEYRVGGIIYQCNPFGDLLFNFPDYPDGSPMPPIEASQLVLMHEIGHMLNDCSVNYEKDRYQTIFNLGINDPKAYIDGDTRPIQSEEIIRVWQAYCHGSEITLNTVAARGNPILSQKLSHVIDLIPTLDKNIAPFFTSDPLTGVTSVTYVPCTRALGQYPGDDGMITSVNGIFFWSKRMRELSSRNVPKVPVKRK